MVRKKRHKRSFFIGTLLILAFAGCEEELPPRSYIERVENEKDGFQKSEEIDGTRYTLRHMPPAYLFLRQKGPEGSSSQAWKEARSDYRSGVRFDLRIFPSSEAHQDWIKKGGPGSPGRRVRYYSFGMREDLKLISDEDTLGCQNFHFERTYGHTPYLSFLFSFDRGKLPDEGPYTVRFENSLSKDGPIKFRFSEEVLTDPPELKFDQ